MSPSLTHKTLGLSVLTLALLAGCASQDALTEKTDPIWYKLNQLEAAQQSATADGKARDEAMARQLEAMQAELRALQERQSVQGEALSKAELRLDEVATQGRDNAQAIAAQQEGLAGVADLSERLTKAELRLDEVATVSSGAADAATLAQQGLAASSENAAGLGERLARTEQRVEALSAQVQEAMAASRQDYIRQHGKVAAIVLLTEDKTLYPINSPELGAGDRAKLDDLASRLRGSQEEYHLDIQGHTDNIGTDDMNYALGKARAEVVKRYLHERGSVPLSRMSTISYGATQPVTGTSSGNRRIVINLLVLEKDKK